MRKALFGGAFIALGLTHAALAADIPAPAPAAKAPVVVLPSWTGFYLNAGGGYGMWVADTSTSRAPGGSLLEPVMPVEQRYGGRGWVVRAGGGFDYQFNSRIVAGLFADYDYSQLQGTLVDAVSAASADIKQDWSWAAGARIGWLATPQLLTYVNAGYSSAHFTSGTMVSFATFAGNPVAPGAPTGFRSPAFTASGWFLGGGLETALGSGWYWRNEYRYVYYGDQKVPDLNVSAPTPTLRLNDINFRPQVQTFTTQILYKFNGAAATSDGAPAPRAPINWTGFHFGGGVGYGMLAADVTTNQTPAPLPWANVVVPQRMGGRGWLGRVSGGYDQQLGSFVAGVFADFDYSVLKGTLTDPVMPISGELKQSWSWAAGGRAGVVVTPEMMGYIAGGYASTRFDAVTLTDPTGGVVFGPGGGRTPAFTANGWFISGGTEYAVTMFGSGLFWRNEYRYADYSSQTLTDTLFGAVAPPLPSINYKPVVQTITTQLVYKFNWWK